MNSSNYTFEIRMIQMLICPPWPILRIALSENLKPYRKTSYFLSTWVAVQWLLLINTGNNIVISYFCSNISLVLFFGLNIYFGYNVSDFSEGEKEILYNFPFMVFITVVSFLAMYSFPIIISNAYNLAKNPMLTNTIQWSLINICINTLLLVSWGVFMFKDKYKIFSLFPKSALIHEQYNMSFTGEKRSKIIVVYCVIGLSFLAILLK